MLATATESPAVLASDWLARFAAALADEAALRQLFDVESHWRDVLALTWRIRTVSSRDALVPELSRCAAAARAARFELDPTRTPPRQVTRAGTACIEAIFRFQTSVGRGSGVLRLLAGDQPKAWTFLTALDEIRGHEEMVGRRRPSGQLYSRDFAGPNWLEQR
ncbi:MAG TPA: monooxygenase, partial [Burkholderiales bacterium]|nr:monooxygenase [Burkholderiales bacterium]